MFFTIAFFCVFGGGIVFVAGYLWQASRTHRNDTQRIKSQREAWLAGGSVGPPPGGYTAGGYTAGGCTAGGGGCSGGGCGGGGCGGGGSN